MITTRSFVALGALLALGLLLFGLQIGRAVKTGRDFDRYFTVRGLSEREVKANLVMWPIRFGVAADDLPALQEHMQSARTLVMDFLAENQIVHDDCTLGLPAIADHLNEHREREQPPIPRYSAVTTLVVRSREVDRVKAAIQKSDTLISRGIALISDDYEHKIAFLYDGLNAIKPGMIEEATANARTAAQKFARDSQASVGKIRRATQGVFEIEDRDLATPEMKLVRVVTTVDFFIGE